jgi:prepilin-type N-terminal cleavage/methylation domain-containing protein
MTKGLNTDIKIAAGGNRVLQAGVTLIELLLTMFISAIAITGLVSAYVDGLSQWRRAAERMLLYSEGNRALHIIEQRIFYATELQPRTQGGYANSRLDVKSLVNYEGHVVPRESQFYYNPGDNSLRWNDLTGNQGYFNKRLLPMYNFSRRRNDPPYISVESATFRPIDPIPPMNPFLEGYSVIKVELALRTPRGDSVYLSSVMSKRNQK